MRFTDPPGVPPENPSGVPPHHLGLGRILHRESLSVPSGISPGVPPLVPMKNQPGSLGVPLEIPPAVLPKPLGVSPGLPIKILLGISLEFHRESLYELQRKCL